MPSLTQNLFAAPLARRADPATSHAAAQKIAPKLGGQLARILNLIRQYPDCTAGELAAHSSGELDQVTICKRVSILDRDGLIEINEQGRPCRVRGNLARTYRATTFTTETQSHGEGQ